jgi:hypothetical protein
MIPIIGDLKPPALLSLRMSDALRGYLEIRPEHGQPVCFAALLGGLKPVMDDWVSRDRLGQLTDVCREHGLTVSADVQFEALADQGRLGAVVGRETLTTTRARGHALADRVAEASVHVFIGADRRIVERTQAAGWYPLIIGDRAMNKPWIDHLWFGAGLGYPECCLAAFARNNNWTLNNMPYQAYRSIHARPSYLCNSLMRFSGLTWAAHLPCRYDCAATAESARRAREVMTAYCPELASWIDRISSVPYLVLNEWEAFAFTGATVWPGGVDYASVTLVPSNRPNLPLLAALQRGRRLELRDNLVVIFDLQDDVVHVEDTAVDTFAPRIPFLMDFRPDLEPAAS